MEGAWRKGVFPEKGEGSVAGCLRRMIDAGCESSNVRLRRYRIADFGSWLFDGGANFKLVLAARGWRLVEAGLAWISLCCVSCIQRPGPCV